MAKLKFQHHYSVFGVSQSFRNHSNMPICCSRNINVENIGAAYLMILLLLLFPPVFFGEWKEKGIAFVWNHFVTL